MSPRAVRCWPPGDTEGPAGDRRTRTFALHLDGAVENEAAGRAFARAAVVIASPNTQLPVTRRIGMLFGQGGREPRAGSDRAAASSGAVGRAYQHRA